MKKDPKERNHASLAQRDRELFDRISGHYVLKDMSPASRPARRLRLLQTLRRTELSADTDVLEVGCGAGFGADYLENRYRSYLGIDHSTALIGLAQERWGERSGKVTFRPDDASRMQSERPFDAIFMIGVLHHMEAPQEALRNLHTLLNNGGWIAVNEPSSLNPLIQILRRIRKRSDATYSEDQETYLPNDLKAQLQKAGFVDVEIVPQGLLSTPFAEVPLRPSWLFSPLARMACAIDRFIEKSFPRLIRPLSWNLIATGRKQALGSPPSQ